MNAHRFVGMIFDGRIKILMDFRSIWHDTDFDARERCLSSIRQSSAGKFRPAGPSNMRFAPNFDVVAYVRFL